VDTDEQPLAGGNVAAGVVRVGGTVRRPAGPWTPAVHALLAHLHAVGFDGAPRPLGIDEHGREVLTYAPGVVPWPERFDLLHPTNRIARVARLIRALHDATQSFTPPADARWQVLNPSGETDLIIHHDLAPWNLVVGDRWVFIDWDSAGPGSRLWDLAYAIHGFVPLSAIPSLRRPDTDARLRTFAAAYRLDEAQRQALVPLLVRRTRAMHDFLAAEAARGTAPWTRLWREGHGEVWRADADYIARYEQRWATALDVES
jgi:Ser/Thr protein kinase RdoA (MazF antagonist)